MMHYGDAVAWSISHNAVFRFVKRRERGEFYAANMDIPGDKALEMAIDIAGKTVAGHFPLDASKEPSAAIALAIIGCVEFFAERERKAQAVARSLN